MFNGKIINVQDVLVRKEVTEKCFCCDLSKCKGACCFLESEYGAPLLEEEIDEIQSALTDVLGYLPDHFADDIRENGFFEEKEGELLTRSFNNRECLFVHYVDGIAFCGIESAFLDGKIAFRKPISCHLFPIRISRFGGDILRYEKFSECEDALLKGEKENINLVDFAKDSLVRKYGEEWYKTLKERMQY